MKRFRTGELGMNTAGPIVIFKERGLDKRIHNRGAKFDDATAKEGTLV